MNYDKICGIKFNLNYEQNRKLLDKYSSLFIFSKYARTLYREKLNTYETPEAAREKENRTDYIKTCNEILTQKFLDGCCVCILPASLGDSMLFFEYKDSIEKYHNVKCFPVLKKSHSVIPVLYGEKDYLIINNIADLSEIPIVKALYYGTDDISKIAEASPSIQKQKLFFAHADWHPLIHKTFVQKHKENYFLEKAKFLYDIPFETALNKKLDLNRIKTLSGYENAVLLAPESAAPDVTQMIDKTFWIETALSYKQQGFDIVYNAVNKIDYLEPYAKWLDCPLETALAAAKNACRIISIRSGFCDLLHDLGAKLCVIYPFQELYDKFSLNDMFKQNNINEYLYGRNLKV